MKRTPINRGSGGLTRSSPMSRGAPMKRSTRLAPRSAKMAAKYAGAAGRRALVRRMLAVNENGVPTAPCQARIDGRCTGTAEHVHELLARSASGPILDEANCIAICARCHAWIGDHPLEALDRGLRLSRYPARNPTTPSTKEPS